MNFEHIISDSTGLMHLIASLIALISGTVVLIKSKGTKWHKRNGYIYSVAMTIVLITSFLMYNLYGKFGIFHWLAVVSSVTLIGGLIPMYLKKPKSYVTMHFSFMYWSVMGLYGAFIAEILVRIPKSIMKDGSIDPQFYLLVDVGVFIIMGFGSIFFKKKKITWEKFDGSQI
ncbi:MAG: DUF2306 domain-containing protein [Bacteroidia bacterium]|nr:DUF2306 domain-containing protein [Bacteroidia bacterium]